MTGWNEEILRKAASWKAFKEGKSLFEAGAVTDARSGSSGYQGSVAGGRRPTRVSVTVRSASDLETKCSCLENQSTGAVCCHAVAVGLAILAGKTTKPTKPETVTSEASPVVLAWQIVFAQNWRDSLERGKLAATLIAAGGEVSGADERFCRWLAGERVIPKPGITLNLAGPQTTAFLEALAEHPRVAAGKERIPVSIQAGGRIALEDAALVDDRIRLRPRRDEPRWTPVGDAFWRVEGDQIVKLGPDRSGFPDPGNLAKLAAGGACELAASDFLAGLDPWQEWVVVPEGGWLDSLHFVPAEASFEIHLEGSLQHLEARLRVNYDAAFPVPPGLGKVKNLPAISNDRCLVRNLAAEESAVRRLESAGFQSMDLAQGTWVIQGESMVIDFLTGTLPRLRQTWNVTEEERFKLVQKSLSVVSPKIEIRGSGEDWLSFDLKFQAIDGAWIPAEEVRRLLRSGRAAGKVAGGKTLVVAPEVSDWVEPLFSDLNLRQESGCFIANSAAGEVIKQLHKKLGNKHKEKDLGEEVGSEIPTTLHAELRPYQQRGFAWLSDRVRRHGGALLGDDMGLGKTLQTIALMEHLFQSESKSADTVLVVATASLLGNWAAEFSKFAPGREVFILHGSGRDELRDRLNSGQVIITSYGTLARDLAWHLQREYLAVVVDEASLMRNPDTDHAKAVTKLKARHRVALTGTPIENGVRDLWSIFRFVQPGWLGCREDFKKRYEEPLAAGADSSVVTERLRLKISPFFLRRTKDQVAPDLPAKLVIDEFCDLSADQQAVYQQLLGEGRKRVEEMVDCKNSGAARMRMLTALLRLRQTCCDLALLGNDRFNQMSQARRSGKLQRLFELLEEVVHGNHKVLVFSQFQKQLLEIEKLLEERGWSHLRLDGQTRDRQKLVDSFQSEGGPPIFLISLKAGGYGLNLTAADTVIHFDPWWNPAAEAQATDRAHRIGQIRPVTVYRLLARGTVEEKVLRLQSRKRSLAAAIDEGGTGDPSDWGIDDFRAVLA